MTDPNLPTVHRRPLAVGRTTYELDEAAARRAGAVRQGGELRMRCPVHDSSPGTLALRRGRKAAVWHCHAGCDPRAVRDALLDAGVIVRRPADRPKVRAGAPAQAQPPPWIRRVWDRAVPIAETPAATYLRERGLGPPWPAALRWDAARSRMIAPAVRHGSLLGLHATRLPDRERRTYGPVKGAAVRLAPARHGTLAVAEGIETALAYTALTGTPSWAALSAAGLGHAPLPDGLRELVVAADFDGPGLVAAEQLERRAAANRIAVRIALPPRYRTDWADVLAGHRV